MALCENLDIYTKPPTSTRSSADFRSRVYFNFAAAVFIYRWRIPDGSHVSKRGGLKAASNLLHFSIETVDANHDGSTDSVIHFDPSNSVTLLGVANLTAHDFLFL